MAITKPDMEFIWASGGAIVEPSDTKKQLGWTAEVPPHQWENWIQNRQDQYLAHINERGIPEWDGLTNYLASGLSYVQGSDGVVYKSVAASGPATTIQDPTTDATDTYWTVAFADVGAFLTQAVGDARYAQLANNLSDLTNAATARTNLGIVDASETTKGLVELATSAETATGTSTSLAVHPAGLLSLFSGANQSKTASGYQRLPSGLIVQWGETQNTNVTFPLQFPTAVLQRLVVLNDWNSASSAAGAYTAITSISTTGFTVASAASGLSAYLRWVAIGH